MRHAYLPFKGKTLKDVILNTKALERYSSALGSKTLRSQSRPFMNKSA